MIYSYIYDIINVTNSKKEQCQLNAKELTSRNNPYIKEVAKLSDKKHRDTENKFCFEGKKLLEEAILSRAPIEAVLFTQRALNDDRSRLILEKAADICEMYLVTDEVYDKISFEKSPEGIFTVSNTLKNLHSLYSVYDIGNGFAEKLLILDGVRDPGNLGTVLRTASAFGIENVILSSDSADVYNPKTVRASMGAVFRIKTSRVSDLEACIKHLKENGIKVYSAALSDSAISLIDVKDTDKAVFVIGNEGSGIRQCVMDKCDGFVMIPMENGTESLNAASAAAIILWEQYRKSKQR